LATPARKTTAPDLKGPTIGRRRLIEDLRSAETEITLIQAAAGSGKTVLASQWSEAIGDPVVWVNLDDTDNDPVVLISTVLEAVHRAGLAGHWGDNPLTGDEPTYSRRVAPHFLVRVESQATRLTLVMEDVHELRQPAVLSLVKATVESLPPGSHVILSGRSLTSLPVTDWLAQHRATLVTDADLALDETEVAELLHEMNGQPAEPRSVQGLLTLTEGWPIAVYLGARTGDLSGLSGEVHFNAFLDREVLRGAHHKTVRFLLCTSPLDDLSAQLCDHVLQQTNSRELLQDAEARSLLVTRGKDQSWYRLHPLLREHLLGRFVAEEPEAYQTVLRRASEWTRDAGFIDRAITYARTVGDLGLLGSLVWGGAAQALQVGQRMRVQSWLDTIDERDIASTCALALGAAWTAMNAGSPAEVYRWSQCVFETAPEGWEDEPGRSSVTAGIVLLASVSGGLGYERSAQLVEQTLAGLPADDLLRPILTLVSGLMRSLAGDTAQGVENLRLAAHLATARGYKAGAVEANSLLATVLIAQGSTTLALPLIRQSQQSWQSNAISHSLATKALLIGPALLLAARTGQVEATRVALDQVESTIESFGPMLPWLPPIVEAFAADACMHLGDIDQALIHLSRADAAAGKIPESPVVDDLRRAVRQAVHESFRLSVLSRAEQRVWELLQTRATLREIADTLFVSHETVKTQTGSIYRKLQISSRREAQELGDRLNPVDHP
jgi:LuxR family maltose regulon positive regulatory protein